MSFYIDNCTHAPLRTAAHPHDAGHEHQARGIPHWRRPAPPGPAILMAADPANPVHRVNTSLVLCADKVALEMKSLLASIVPGAMSLLML